jgi:hypothetical protein
MPGAQFANDGLTIDCYCARLSDLESTQRVSDPPCADNERPTDYRGTTQNPPTK